MPKGIIKSIDKKRGEIVIRDENGEDVFVHHASIIAEGWDNLQVGDNALFDLIDPQNKRVGKNVVKVP